MEKDLASIRWDRLATASGKADHVPEALLGLLSPDEKARRYSYWRLDNVVVLQSDLYEAAYFVVPFLIRWLKLRVEYGRDRIYDLLFEIANGYAPPETTCLTVEGDEISLKAACQREVKKGMSVFLRDTSDADGIVRDKAKELLELLAEEMS